MRTQLINYSGYELEALPPETTVAELLRMAHENWDKVLEEENEEYLRQKKQLEGKCFLFNYRPVYKVFLYIEEVMKEESHIYLKGRKIGLSKRTVTDIGKEDGWEFTVQNISPRETFRQYEHENMYEIPVDVFKSVESIFEKMFELQVEVEGQTIKQLLNT